MQMHLVIILGAIACAGYGIESHDNNTWSINGDDEHGSPWRKTFDEEELRAWAEEGGYVKDWWPAHQLRILFDGPPGPESGRFVETHNSRDEGVKCGEWAQREDGYWQLVITDLPIDHNTLTQSMSEGT